MAHKRSPDLETDNRSNDLDAYARERIEFRVRQLTYQFELSADQQEDYRAEMIAELLAALDRFNPARAKRNTFVNRVLDKYLLYATRRRCTQMRRPYDSPVGLDDVADGYRPVVNEPRQGRRDEQARCELRLDVEAAVAAMPAPLRRTCRLLMAQCTPTEAARALGIHRQTFYRRAAAIRRRLAAAGLNEFQKPRDRSRGYCRCRG